jgi:predicted nucleic acid-binding protein
VTGAAVADTGPLIHLAAIDSLSLLSTVEQLYLPQVVVNEFAAGNGVAALAELGYDTVDADTEHLQDEPIDDGERAALAVAIENDAMLLTDDLDARDSAADHGVEVHGSIGVITLGHSRGQLGRDDAAALMRALQRETSRFVTDAVVERGIDRLDA